MKDLLELNPIICAIKSDEHLEDAANSDGDIVFLLNEDILSLKEKIEFLHKHNKKVFVHIDMITGILYNNIYYHNKRCRLYEKRIKLRWDYNY